MPLGTSDEIVALRHELAAAQDAIVALRRALKVAQTAAARDVLSERARQMGLDGFAARHDDRHAGGQLARAAAACALAAGVGAEDAGPTDARATESRATESKGAAGAPHRLWPWPEATWRSLGARETLVHAGALILAEIERRDRQAKRGG